jgi:hypothetical protein
MLEINRVALRVPSLEISPSADGYVRLSKARMRAIPLVHLISGLDEEPTETPMGPVGATLAAIAGYTEWASPTTPALSVGWDWVLEPSERELRYLRMGEPRSNIMLIDQYGRDIGPVNTAAALSLLVDEASWYETVAEYVKQRYA